MVVLQTLRSAQAAQCSAIDTPSRSAHSAVFGTIQAKAGYPERVNNEGTGCLSTKCYFLTFKSENH
jgi:hypothetical protein